MKRISVLVIFLVCGTSFQPLRAEKKLPDFGPLETLKLKPRSPETKGLSVYGFLRWKYFLSAKPVGEMPSLEGTTWEGPSQYDGFIRWHFGAKGKLSYANEYDTWTNGSWTQRGEAVYIEANGRYAEHIGVFKDGAIIGNGHNVGGVSTWQWSVRPVKKKEVSKEKK